MITVLLVDDHASILKSLQYLLEATDDIQVLATASNGMEAVAWVSSHCPDVVVMDISMPLMDGMEATRQIRQCCPLTRVMMLSMFDSAEYIRRALEVGALGYVLKDTVGDDLLIAVRVLSTGRQYFSQKIATIAEKFLNQKGNDTWAG
jgi:two-component system nitrate/nitrite response regulator NarL